MSIWKKIKNWFTGSSESKKNRAYAGISQKNSGSTSNASAVRDAYREAAEKRKNQEAEQKAAYEKAEKERKAKAEERRKNAQANDVKTARMNDTSNTASNAVKQYRKTVESEAEKQGVSASKLQKMGGTDKTRAQDIKSSYKAAPLLTAASEGALRGATMGLSDIVTKNTKGETRKALENAQKNYTTGQKVANVVGELGGSLVTFGGANGLSEKIGSKVISKATGGEAKAIEKLASSNFIKKYASKLSQKAEQEITADALAKSFYKELSTDLGMNLGVGNVQALVDAAETDGDLGDKLGSYAINQGINTLIGVPLNKWQAGKGAINTARKALAEDVAGDVADKAREVGYAASHPYSEVTGLVDDPNVSAISNLENDISKLEKAKAKLKDGDSKISMIDDQIAANKALIEKYKAKTELPKTKASKPQTYRAGKNEYFKMSTADGTEVKSMYHEADGKGYGIYKNPDAPSKKAQYVVRDLETGTDLGYKFSKQSEAVEYLKDPEAFVQKRKQEYEELANRYAEIAQEQKASKQALKNPENEYWKDHHTRNLKWLHSEALQVNGRMQELERLGYATERNGGRLEVASELAAKRAQAEARVEEPQSVKDKIRSALGQEEPTELPRSEVELPTAKAETPTSNIAQLVRGIRENGASASANSGRAVSPRIDGERVNVSTGEVIPRHTPTTSVTSDEVLNGMPTAKEQADIDEYLSRLNARENNGSKQDLLEEYTRRYKDGTLPVRNADTATVEQTAPATKQDLDELLEAKAKAEAPKSNNINAENAEFNRANDAFNDNNRDVRIGEASKTSYASTKDATQRKIFKEDTFDSDVEDGLFEVLHRDETAREAADSFSGKSAKQVLDDIINIGNGGLKVTMHPESAAIARRNVEKVAQAMIIAGRKISTTADSVWADVYQAASKLYVNYGNLFGGGLNAYGDYAKLTGRGAKVATERNVFNILDENIKVRNLLGMKDGEKFDSSKLIALADKLEATAKSTNETKRAAALRQAIEDIENLPDLTDPDEIKNASAKIVAAVSESVPRTYLDAINEWRYLAMLGNFKTHIRNKLGNSLFRQVRKTSGDIASALEGVYKSEAYKRNLAEGVEDVAIATGRNANATANAKIKIASEADLDKLDELGKVAYEGWLKDQDALLGHSTKYETNIENSFSGEAKEAIKWLKESISQGKGTVHSLAELNSGFLELADKKALELRYREFVYNFCEKNGYKLGNKLTSAEVKRNKSVMAMAKKLAGEEALISTFRNHNALASSLYNLSRGVTQASTSGEQKVAGFITNSIFPFLKTPLNILKQSIDYSPIGLVKGRIKIAQAIKQGDPMAMNDAIQEMASGLTGTGIIGLGLGLGLLGSDDGPLDGVLEFTTNVGNDANAKHEKNQGKMNYSAVVGDKMAFSLDWLTPVATTFFTGVEIAKQLKDKDLDVGTLLTDIPVIVSRAVEPTLETSMLSGIDNVLKSIENAQYTNDDENFLGAMSLAGKGIAQNYASSLIPTLFGQVARSIAPTQKATGGDNYFRNTMMNKVPGLNLLLPEDTDDWGNVKGSWFNYGGKKNAADYALQTAANLLSPSNISTVNLDENDEELKRLYEQTGDESVFPTKLYSSTRKYGSGDNATVLELTDKERSIYNKAKATSQGGKDAMQTALQSDMFESRYDGMSTMQKAKAIDNELSSAPKSTKAMMNWLRQQPEYQNASEEERVSLLNSVFSTSDSEKAKGNEKSGERAVIKSRGEDVTDYEVKNNLNETKYASYKAYEKDGVLDAETVNDFYKYAVKDGQVSKKDATAYFAEHPELTSEQKNALYEIFKYSNAKSYSDSSSSSSSSSKSGSSSSSSSSSSSDKSKAPDMGTTRNKSKYKDMGSAVKKNKSVKDVVELKSNYSSKLKPPTAKW